VARGRLITIEGLDGAGKTTLAAGLRDELARRGVDVQLLREPGGVELAERVRELVKDPAMRVGARAEALLYAAARAQLVEEAVEPLLENGTWVLLDRFVDSSLAYQGGARGLGVDAVAAINDFATGGLRADRTLLLLVDPALGRARQAGRGEAPDRLESEQEEFFAAVAEGYRRLAEAEPERVRVIEAGGTPEEVLAAALRELEDLLPSIPEAEAATRDPIDVVREIYAAWERREFASELFDAEVEFFGPLGIGEARGIDAVRASLREFVRSFRDLRTVVREFVASGDRVLVVATLVGEGKDSGIEVAAEGGHVFTVRNGKVVRVAMYSSEAPARADFESPAQSP
jgi:dTMP kinase